VPNMAVFCSSLTSWFPGMLLTYFLNDFEMVPVAPIIIIIIIFTFTQGIYNCIPATDHDSTVYSVAAVLCLQYL
jgi:hypothetical protein